MEMRDLGRSESGTNGDSSANKAPFSGHNLTTENFARAERSRQINAECDILFAEFAAANPPKAKAVQFSGAPRPQVATIYFIGPKGGPIKIGYAERLEARLKDLRLANAYPLEVHASVEGHPSLEREYHARFKAHRLHGEWFEPHPDILAEIERLNAPRLPMHTPLPGKQEQQP